MKSCLRRAAAAADVIGSRGADVTVTFNGAVVLSGEHPDSVRIPVPLLSSSTLVVQ